MKVSKRRQLLHLLTRSSNHNKKRMMMMSMKLIYLKSTLKFYKLLKKWEYLHKNSLDSYRCNCKKRVKRITVKKVRMSTWTEKLKNQSIHKVKLSQELNFLSRNRQVLPTYYTVIEKKNLFMMKKMRSSMEMAQTKLTPLLLSTYWRSKVLRSRWKEKKMRMMKRS
jgi:hypothetical protein